MCAGGGGLLWEIFLCRSSIWGGTNIRDTGWLGHSARLGAPFGAEFHDFPVIFLHNFDELLFKAVLVFVPDVFETVNVVFLLTPVLSCWTS